MGWELCACRAMESTVLWACLLVAFVIADRSASSSPVTWLASFLAVAVAGVVNALLQRRFPLRTREVSQEIGSLLTGLQTIVLAGAVAIGLLVLTQLLGLLLLSPPANAPDSDLRSAVVVFGIIWVTDCLVAMLGPVRGARVKRELASPDEMELPRIRWT